MQWENRTKAWQQQQKSTGEPYVFTFSIWLREHAHSCGKQYDNGGSFKK
jgi:hypothetical protein